MQMTATEVDDAVGQMWAIRQAVLEAAEMDASIEPIPLGGRSERLGLLNLVIYLGHLVERAAAHQEVDRQTIVDRALRRPILHQVRRPVPRVRELRSS